MSDERWVEVSQSQFTHETEGLQYLKSKLPQQSPYRAWTNFEFRDGRGRWHEVDALVLTQSRLHLIELKHYVGRLRGSDHTWLRDGKRAEDSPLLLARRKAQYLASKLKDELRALAKETGAYIGDERKVIPFVQESVFLHHENFICELPEPSTIGLYGLDERETTSHLRGISHLLLGQQNNAAIGPNQEAILVTLLKRIGLVQRREREIGSWVIEENAVDEGPGWQDWRGYHKVAKEQLARIRFQVSAPGAPASQQAEQHKIAQHEFSVMSKLSHDGILSPRDLIEGDLGVGLVYNFTQSTERLDLWLASQNGLALERQLKLIHELGETLAYAHSHGVVHRGLSPRAVWISTEGDEQRAQIGDWKSAGLAEAERTANDGVTHLAQNLADNFEQAWLTEAFEAPEDRWSRNADRIRIDVFGLGALAYFVLTGKSPAQSLMALGERVRTQNGLDVSIDLPEIPEPIRQAVLNATRPAPSERTNSIRGFLQDLDAVPAQAPTDVDEPIDPLDAKPGAVLAGRFTVTKRLGRGSTALGLLVRDADDDDSERVLKVALNAKAAERLAGEAEVLRKLKGTRLVKLVKGAQPLTIEGRESLLLESAGTQTLSEVLRGQRLSLDYLERYGTDLLEALVQLDAAGVDHRDIKPSNLGVRERRGGKHLVLFDFSLSRASAAALHAGTPPYLDPFLGGSRQVFDSAAERYSAAVVLFEMATGHTPFYGDPMANPASVEDAATIEPSDFDEAVRGALDAFFRKALLRDASKRHHTAQEMLELWQAAFSATSTATALDADRVAEAATLETPLRGAGFSARALSAVEHLGVLTVGDLVTLEPVRLNHLAGSAESTRKEVKSRASTWRKKFGAKAQSTGSGTRLPSPRSIAETLEAGSGAKRSTSKLDLLRSILGLTGTANAFATHGALGAGLQKPISSARVNQLLDDIQDAWAGNEACLEKLKALSTVVEERLTGLGGVATITELTEAILESTTSEGSRGERRVAEGLLRIVAVDRARALKRAEADGGNYELRRRAGTVVLIGRSTTLLDLAEQLGHEADQLLAQSPGDYAALVPAERVAPRLAKTVASFRLSVDETDGQRTAQLQAALAVLTSPARLVRLAASMSKEAAASGAAELHHRDLTQHDALRLAFRGLAGAQRISRHEVTDRVRVRFPAVPLLPGDSRLDALVEAAGLNLRFNPETSMYESRELSVGSSGASSFSTHTRMGDAPIAGASVVVQRLKDSVERRSFLGLGVKASRTGDLVRALETEFDAATLDLTDALIEAMRALAAEGKSPAWERLAAADAQPAGSRDQRGLAAVVGRALPRLEERIAELAADNPRQRPVLITEASPLARYGRVDVLKRWSDMTLKRGQAIWVVLPQTDANQGPLLDGSPVLTSPNQFLAIDSDWVSARRAPAAPYEGVTP